MASIVKRLLKLAQRAKRNCLIDELAIALATNTTGKRINGQM